MSNAPFEEVGPKEAVTLVEEGAYLLDVREPGEWAAGHAEVAHHIPLGDLRARYTEVPTDLTVVCICRSGGRSAQAAAALASVGYSTINVAGGMIAWSGAELPVVTDDGASGSVI